MQGKVKWFSVDKGYGFIVGNDGTERFFGVRDVQGTDLPANGDVVSFEPQAGKKGPRAAKVAIVSRASPLPSFAEGIPMHPLEQVERLLPSLTPGEKTQLL
jgi:cold shock CspA family protein